MAKLNYKSLSEKRNLIQWLKSISLYKDESPSIKKIAKELLFLLEGNYPIPSSPSYEEFYKKYKLKISSVKTDDGIRNVLQSYDGTKSKSVGVIQKLVSKRIPQAPIFSATPTPTPTVSITRTVTPSISITRTVTPSISVTRSVTPTVTPSISITPSINTSPTPTPSISESGPSANVMYYYRMRECGVEGEFFGSSPLVVAEGEVVFLGERDGRAGFCVEIIEVLNGPPNDTVSFEFCTDNYPNDTILPPYDPDEEDENGDLLPLLYGCDHPYCNYPSPTPSTSIVIFGPPVTPSITPSAPPNSPEETVTPTDTSTTTPTETATETPTVTPTVTP